MHFFLVFAMFLQTASSGISMTAAMPESAYNAGDRIPLTITFRNESQHEIFISETNGADAADRDFELEVLNDGGQRVPYTLYGKEAHSPDPGRFRFFSFKRKRIEAGGSIQQVIVLNKVFDLTLPGKYSVRVTRQPRNDGTAPATKTISNTVIFDIDP